MRRRNSQGVASTHSSEEHSSADSTVTCASWIKSSLKNPQSRILVGKISDSKTGILELVSHDSKNDLVSQVNSVDEEAVPVSLVVHPSGDGVLVSFAEECKYFDLDSKQSTLETSDMIVSPLKGVGPQNCLVFSADGSKLAMGGKDGHLRVFEWPSLQVLIDQPNAHTSFKDLDLSLDSAFLASTSSEGPARVWDLIKCTPIAMLSRDQGENIDLCRFSRDGTKPFLFGTVTKDGRGTISVWNMATWKKIGYKMFIDSPISAFDASENGKYLAIGSATGDIQIIDVKKMEAKYSIKRAHIGATITSLEFSPTGRTLLSVSPDWAMKVNLMPEEWKDWQIYVVLLSLVFVSAILFYIFFEHSDSFWNFPLGRDQPARPPIEAILGDP